LPTLLPIPQKLIIPPPLIDKNIYSNADLKYCFELSLVMVVLNYKIQEIKKLLCKKY